MSGGVYRDDPVAPLYETPLAPMPAWLLALATAPASTNAPGAETAEPDWAALLAGAPEGQRHAVAAQITGHLLGKRLAPSEVETIVVSFAERCAPPFPREEARRIVRDLAAKDAARAIAQNDGHGTAAPEEPFGIGLGDFLAQSFAEPVPYVEGILSDDGGGWLGGEEKLGKTYYALEEAACLALALPVCGRFTVPTRRRVLFLEEEDPPRRMHRRLRALLRGHGRDPDDPVVRTELNAWFRVSVWAGFTVDDGRMAARLDAALAEFRPAVVYLDALRKLTLRDLNKTPEAAALFGVLDDFRRRYGVAFRLVHHYRKAQGFRAGRGSQEIAHSYVLGAWGENSLFFEPIGRGQGAVRVTAQSKDGPPVAPFRLIFETEGPPQAPTVVRLKAEDDRDSADDLDEEVFQAIALLPQTEALTGGPGVTLETIAEAVKRRPRTLRRSITRLEDTGRIVATGKMAKGKYLYGVQH